MVRHIKELIESGQFKPVIDRTYPLDQIVVAYRYVETGDRDAMNVRYSSLSQAAEEVASLGVVRRPGAANEAWA
jgi:hypothetical protein